MVEQTTIGSHHCAVSVDGMAGGWRRYLHSRSPAIKRSAAVCLLAFMFSSGAATVRAEVRVSGDVNAMSLTVSQSKISEILSALKRDYKVQYRTSVTLDAPITAAYSGSLKEVLARVLVGYTYVVRQTETSAEVIVIGKKGDRAIVGIETAGAPPAKSPAAQWRAMLNGETASPQNGNSRPTPKSDR